MLIVIFLTFLSAFHPISLDIVLSSIDLLTPRSSGIITLYIKTVLYTNDKINEIFLVNIYGRSCDVYYNRQYENYLVTVTTLVTVLPQWLTI